MEMGCLTSKEKEVLPKHNFYKYFGKVITDIFSYFKTELKWYHRTQYHLECLKGLPEHFNQTNSLIEKYIPIWEKLKSYNEGFICFHIYRIFYSLLKDPEYYQLPDYDKNVLLWSVLLHDICKRGYPDVHGKDPIHPFRSAWLSLYYFNDIFKFVSLSKEDFEEWDEIFEGGYVKKYGVEVQNHGIVPLVKLFLDKRLKDNEFEKEVIYHVMLHQSVPTIKMAPHMSMLQPLHTEVPKYFNKRSIRVFRIFLKHDSSSYLIYFTKLKVKFWNEIEENIRTLEKHIK